MINISDYILSFDNVLDQEFCSKLIEEFELTGESEYKRKSEHKWDQDYRSFTELNVSRDEHFKWAHDKFFEVSKELARGYRQQCQAHFFPKQFGFEDARMKKYENNDKDQFGWHVDVGDYPSARRYLVIFYYLNDVEEGGETVFALNDEKLVQVRPKRGRIVMFPPMWMFPHIGAKPISNPKYIVSTYLHYL